MSDLPGDYITVHEALSRVMGAVGAIGKGRRMEGSGGYAYRSIEQMLPLLQPALVDQGVLMVPVSWETLADVEYQTKGGARMRSLTLRATWRIFGPGGDSFDVQSIGEAADAGDKAANKAMTGAHKAMIEKVLCIPTESADDPDHGRHERQGDTITAWTEEQRAVALELDARIDQLHPAVAERLVAKVTKAGGHGFTSVAGSLSPGWLDFMAGLVDKAEQVNPADLEADT